MGFLDVTKLLMHGFGYFAHGLWIHLDTAEQPIGTIKIGGLFLLPESCLQLTAKILVEWVVFADVTLAICMDLAMLCATCLQRWLVSAVLGAVH
jgi:hypothetical protein